MSAEQYIIFRRHEPGPMGIEPSTRWEQLATVAVRHTYDRASDVLEYALEDNPDWGEGEYFVVPLSYGQAQRLVVKARTEYDVEKVEEPESEVVA